MVRILLVLLCVSGMIGAVSADGSLFEPSQVAAFAFESGNGTYASFARMDNGWTIAMRGANNVTIGGIDAVVDALAILKLQEATNIDFNEVVAFTLIFNYQVDMRYGVRIALGEPILMDGIWYYGVSVDGVTYLTASEQIVVLMEYATRFFPDATFGARDGRQLAISSQL